MHQRYELEPLFHGEVRPSYPFGSEGHTGQGTLRCVSDPRLGKPLPHPLFLVAWVRMTLDHYNPTRQGKTKGNEWVLRGTTLFRVYFL